MSIFDMSDIRGRESEFDGICLDVYGVLMSILDNIESMDSLGAKKAETLFKDTDRIYSVTSAMAGLSGLNLVPDKQSEALCRIYMRVQQLLKYATTLLPKEDIVKYLSSIPEGKKFLANLKSRGLNIGDVQVSPTDDDWNDVEENQDDGNKA